MGAGAADIAQVMPEVRKRFPQLPTTAGVESEQARFRFFDSLTTFLTTAARRQPLVLIFDDLHWADTPSLRLLQFVAREIAATPLLVIGTYRDLVLGRDHPLPQTVGEIVRTPGSQSEHLQGLSAADVAQFLTDPGLQPSEALVTAVYRETEGNPFFLTEVVHLLEAKEQQSTGGGQDAALAFTIPQSVQAAIGRRLHPLSANCQHLLQIAAVVGREFSVETLATVGQQIGISAPEDRLFDLLEEAVALRVILEVPAVVGRYSFSHALIRETLYEELSALRRVRLHQQIATILEHRYGSPAEAAALPHAGTALAELAYHFFQAAQGGQAINEAIAYARQAGTHAMSVFAYEEAVGHYERALQAVARHGAGDAYQRCELLLALGEAQTRGRLSSGAGDLSPGRGTRTHHVRARRTRARRPVVSPGGAWALVNRRSSCRNLPCSPYWRKPSPGSGKKIVSVARAGAQPFGGRPSYYFPQEAERRLRAEPSGGGHSAAVG